MPKLTLFIGIPGSGKTTAAKKYSESLPNHPKIFEADQFFIDTNGNYNWSFNKLKEAHQWCQDMVKNCMERGEDVIVSNTNLTPRERAPYLRLAKQFNYDVEVRTCLGRFQNIHNVPSESLKRMENKFIPFNEKEMDLL